LLRALAEKHKALLCFIPDSDPAVVEVDAAQFQQVLTNLIVNAIQAMPAGGRWTSMSSVRPPAIPTVATTASRRAAPSRSAIKAWHCRREHAAPLRAVLSQPKESAKARPGLSIAYGIVQEHGGWIDVTSRPNDGSCFTVFLPEDLSREITNPRC